MVLHQEGTCSVSTLRAGAWCHPAVPQPVTHIRAAPRAQGSALSLQTLRFQQNWAGGASTSPVPIRLADVVVPVTDGSTFGHETVIPSSPSPCSCRWDWQEL